MSVAQAIIKILLNEEVEKAFCVPGESYLSILDALNDQEHIQLISGRHEGGVSFMTEAYAKASGKVGVCFATRGPGATNLSIGLHTAMQDSTPVVAFVGQVRRNFRGKEGFQEIDHASYFSDLIKWAVELTDASRTDEIVTRAFHIAQTGRPGPVLISLPEDVLDEIVDIQIQKPKVFSRPRPGSEAILETKKWLESAERPIILAGGGISATKSSSTLVRVAEELQIPVVSTFRRFDVFPNHHSHYIGSLGLGTPPYIIEAIQASDVVLALGTRFSEVTTQDYTLLHSGQTLIHVDISVNEINKSYQPSLGVVTDVHHFMTDLIKENVYLQHIDKKKSRLAWLKSKYENASSIPKDNSSDFVDLGPMIGDLMSTLDDDAIITSDAGNFFGWLARYYSFMQEGTYIGPTSGAMGYGLPAAIGAKMAYPNTQVIAYCGDGGFMMTIQELETAIRYNIPIISIVANNNMYGTIRMHQEKSFPHRVIGTDLSNPSFAQYISLMGGHGEIVEKNKEFLPALQRAIYSSKPAVIEVAIDPQQISVEKTIDDVRA
ncbi:acetolactate synthase [Salicibibacter cibarius]|uniref:Acetolactate synthase n=1 Tax=Salicibibacter cibarius TaxID=2743000 RepID=A0A7T6Z773_9BACI|nr:thiamine pyrophosphate-dependent enzyme [Salicibibacter cibarius]QQK78255.1 acetolactate synthase [Salicibibacter cibarius]